MSITPAICFNGIMTPIDTIDESIIGCNISAPPLHLPTELFNYPVGTWVDKDVYEHISALADLYRDITEFGWNALLAWVDDGSYVEGGDGLPDASAFTERYCGQWSNWQEYFTEMIQPGVEEALDNDSELAQSYFNWESYRDDRRCDYTILRASNDDNDPYSVYIFRNL